MQHGRAYPDVAAQAHGVNVIFSGQLQHVGGTSLASPIFAATIALLNDRLFTAGEHGRCLHRRLLLTLCPGKPPLGFLNPWLYKNAGMLNDIQDGEHTFFHIFERS
jgi:tripeptidyl-peptidase-1